MSELFCNQIIHEIPHNLFNLFVILNQNCEQIKWITNCFSELFVNNQIFHNPLCTLGAYS